ncbi:MAG: hypothetical protein WA049_06555 [Ferribacterium limneticum]
MQTINAYQVRPVITGLTNLAEALELAEMPQWHTIASAAACLESLIYGEQPTDLATVAASLKALNIPDQSYRRFGKFTFLTVNLAISILDAIRWDLLDIQPKLPRPPLRPIWIGIDLANGLDRSVNVEYFHA